MRRTVVTLLLASTGLLGGLALAPGALAADPVAAPSVPYGGQLDAPDPGGSFDDEQVLEFSMLALGMANGLAFAVAIVASRMRGPSAAMTRRALIERTAPGRSSEEGWSRRRRLVGPAR